MSDHDQREALSEQIVEIIWPLAEGLGEWPRDIGIYAVAERVITTTRPLVTTVTTQQIGAALHSHGPVGTSWRNALPHGDHVIPSQWVIDFARELGIEVTP